MNYPTLQVTDFLNNPKYVSDLAMSLDYTEKEPKYPGTRTKALHQIDKDLFENINGKLIRLLYPDYNVFRNVSWTGTGHFQKITYDDVEFHILNKENSGKGWIHQDNTSKYTVILYLSKEEGSGTAIYSRKDGFHLTDFKNEDQEYREKIKYSNNIKTKDLKLDEFSKCFNDHKNKFQTECVFNSSYNKMIAFDGATPHGAIYNLKPGEERITYISFFYEISAPYSHIAEMRRI